MAKGNYRKEYGGSKNAYEKGKKDTIDKILNGVGIGLTALASIVLAVVLGAKNK
ncbi:hypothetical protein [Flavobacterium sp. GNP002]